MLLPIANVLAETSLNQWIQTNYWLWPALEITHFIGLSFLMGGLIIVDLRMAGFMKTINPAATHRLLPLVIFGFALNLITGTLFVFGDPFRYAVNIGFQIKMVLIVIAGCNALLYHFKVSPMMQQWDINSNPPLITKVVAFTSLTAWTGVLLFGRLIPYVGTG